MILIFIIIFLIYILYFIWKNDRTGMGICIGFPFIISLILKIFIKNTIIDLCFNLSFSIVILTFILQGFFKNG